MRIRASMIAAAAILAACSNAGSGEEAEEGLRGRGESVANCPAERAVFTLRSIAGPELTFVRNRHAGPTANLVARVTANGAVYWFWLNEAPDFGSIAATRGPDPTDAEPEPSAWRVTRDDITPFTAFTATFDVIDRAPNPGDPAPAHIFTPEMGLALLGATAPPTDGQPRMILPVAMWDFTRCIEDE